MTLVWLIRHAESQGNAGFATADPASIKLTERGLAQAHLVVSAFDRMPDLIVTSPYLRTKQTAEPTHSRFPDTLNVEWPIQELTYLSPLQFRDTTTEQRQTAAQKYWGQADPYNVDGIGAESFAQFLERVHRFTQRIETDRHRFIAVFSHEKFIQAVLWSQLIGFHTPTSQMMIEFRAFSNSFSLPNASFIPLEIKNNTFWFANIVTNHLIAPLPNK